MDSVLNKVSIYLSIYKAGCEEFSGPVFQKPTYLFLWNALESYPNASGHSFGMGLILERSGSQQCGTTRRYILTPALS